MVYLKLRSDGVTTTRGGREKRDSDLVRKRKAV